VELNNNIARDSILHSIRQHLAASVPHDAVHLENAEERSPHTRQDGLQQNGHGNLATLEKANSKDDESLIEIFKESLEAVGGHCIVASSDLEVKEALARIISGLGELHLQGRRIAVSDAPALQRWITSIESDFEVGASPSPAELFGYDVGITTVQAAIAETGTLVLESEVERHRLVSLVPPVHIAIVQASQICLTLGEALAKLSSRLNSAITFITGPSRTADIELTLTVGVHGPQALYVIVIEELTSSR